MDNTLQSFMEISSMADYGVHRCLDLSRYIVKNPESTVVMKITNMSYKEFGITHNDMLVIDTSLSARSGDCVLVAMNGTYHLRKVKYVQGLCYFVSESFALESSQSTNARILGVVTTAIHRL